MQMRNETTCQTVWYRFFKLRRNRFNLSFLPSLLHTFPSVSHECRDPNPCRSQCSRFFGALQQHHRIKPIQQSQYHLLICLMLEPQKNSILRRSALTQSDTFLYALLRCSRSSTDLLRILESGGDVNEPLVSVRDESERFYHGCIHPSRKVREATSP